MSLAADRDHGVWTANLARTQSNHLTPYSVLALQTTKASSGRGIRPTHTEPQGKAEGLDQRPEGEGFLSHSRLLRKGFGGGRRGEGAGSLETPHSQEKQQIFFFFFFDDRWLRKQPSQVLWPISNVFYNFSMIDQAPKTNLELLAETASFQ